MPTVKDTLVRDRKEHRCHFCGLRIRRGARHVLREGVEGCEHWRIRAHEVCEAKTRTWDAMDWEIAFDAVDFRYHELGMRR